MARVGKWNSPRRIPVYYWNFCPYRLWDDTDRLQIAALRLTDVARQFCNGCLELHLPGVIWQKFKDAFKQFSWHSYRSVWLYDATNRQEREKRNSPGICRQVQGTATENSLQGGRPRGSEHPQWECGHNAPGQFCSRVNRSSRYSGSIPESPDFGSSFDNRARRSRSGKTG